MSRSLSVRAGLLLWLAWSMPAPALAITMIDTVVNVYEGGTVTALGQNVRSIGMLTSHYPLAISDDLVVWEGWDETSGERGIYSHDGSTGSRVSQLSCISDLCGMPDVSGTEIVWDDSPSSIYGGDLYHYDGTTTTQYASGRSPTIDGSNRIWWQNKAGSGTGIIYMDDGTGPVEINSWQTYALQPTYYYRLGLSGSKVAWLGNDYELFLYDGISTTELTSSALSVSVAGDYVAYVDFSNEIRLWDGASTVSLGPGSKPSVSDTGGVVFRLFDGNDQEIMYFDGTQVVQLTDNDFDDDSPVIHGTRIAWMEVHPRDEVPEPGAGLLVAIGVLGVAICHRRRPSPTS